MLFGIPAGLQYGYVVDAGSCTIFVETKFVDEHGWANSVDIDSHPAHCPEAACIDVWLADSIVLVKLVQLAGTAGHGNLVPAEGDFEMVNLDVLDIDAVGFVLDLSDAVARMSIAVDDNFVDSDNDVASGLVNNMDTADSGRTVDIVDFAAKPELADTAEAVGTVHAATYSEQNPCQICQQRSFPRDNPNEFKQA